VGEGGEGGGHIICFLEDFRQRAGRQLFEGLFLGGGGTTK